MAGKKNKRGVPKHALSANAPIPTTKIERRDAAQRTGVTARSAQARRTMRHQQSPRGR